MCKIAAVSGVNKTNRDKVWEFMKLLGKQMTPGNEDGLGYAAVTSSGEIFGERWLVNDHAFGSRTTNREIYNSFGKSIDKDSIRSMILHTRMATCGKGIENTHPFIDITTNDSPNLALIHNGVINNHASLTKKYSTCDSEVILHEYDYADVVSDPKNLSSVFDKLSGWFACAVLAKKSNSEIYLDIFTDGTSVESYFINDLCVRIFSTRGHDIVTVANKLNLGYSSYQKLKQNSFRRFNALGGMMIGSGKVTRKEYYDRKKTYQDGWGNSWSSREETEILEYWENFLEGGKI